MRTSFRSPRSAYERVLEKMRREPAALTDDDLSILRVKNEWLANAAKQARTRHRNAAEYQERVAATNLERDYQREIDRRRGLAAARRDPWAAMDRDAGVRRDSKRGVVRVMTPSERRR
jgi:hypothetical protein